MMNSRLVSIIILNWNELNLTAYCLNSLRKVTKPSFEAIVIDNGSENNEYVRLKKEFGDFAKIIKSTKNLGFAAGCNLGIKHSKGKYVLLLNNDTVVTANFLEPLVRTLENDSQIAACQPKILSFKNKNYFDYAGGAGGFLDIFGYPFCRGRIFFSLEKDKGQYDDKTEIFWASGTAMLLRRSVLDKIGLFDEGFFAYAEEVDLCWRMHERGFRVYYVPKSVVYHQGGVTSNKNMFKKVFLVHRNHLMLLWKNLSTKELIFVLPLRTFMDFLSMGYYLLKVKPKLVLSVVLAYLSLLFKLPQIIKKRKTIKEKSKNYEKLIYQGSIVFDHFVRRKKTFQEIFKVLNTRD